MQRFRLDRRPSFRRRARNIRPSFANEQPLTGAGIEALETRTMLTTLSLFVYDPIVAENFGVGATMGEVSRFGGDISQALTVNLASQDETEIVVPTSVTIPANETLVTFPVDVVDDTLLDGDQFVFIDAVAGLESAQTAMLVEDFETADLIFDQTTGSPGDNLTGTLQVSFVESNSVGVSFESSRELEIAPFSVTVPGGSQSAPFSIPVLDDGVPEGPHSVRIDAAPGLYGNSNYLTLTDPGVATHKPVADGYAEDVDQDGQVFESLNLTSYIRNRAAGYATESRGILEFDLSTLPASTVVESAVLTVTFNSGIFPSGTTSIPVDVFAYAGDGAVQSADANEVTTAVGQYVQEIGDVGGSHAVVLDTNAIQSLVDAGNYLGVVTATGSAVDGTSALSGFLSSEFVYSERQPSLHLVYTTQESPVLTANSLSIGEGDTVTLSSVDLAATDTDTEDALLTFSISSLDGGQFLLGGNPVSSFSQSDISAGQVAFQHDGGENGPTYDVVVSDGTSTDGPETASISFTNVNDQTPVIPAGQSFSVAESAATGTAVGTVTASDGDLPGDALTFSITAGNSDGVLGIDNSGDLTVADNANLDFESTSAYVLTIEVFDGVHVSSEDVSVVVTDVNDVAPVITTNLISISEGQWITIDGTNLAATDVDSDDAALTFDVSNVAGGQFYLGITGPVPTTSFTQFEISTGQVSFQHDDGEFAPAFDVTVRDESLSSATTAGVITFINVNDQSPTIPSGQSFSVSEAAATGTTVGVVSFSDADVPGDTLTASISAGNGDGVFGIDNAGAITIADNSNLDYETTSSYVLTIEVFDGVHTTSEDVSIDVDDVSETKFFVVDTSSDSTFEYEANGALADNYSLTSGNNAPRGAAADATGSTIWVIDNDDYVYVYDAAGNTLGQWKANGLNRPEGIATDGTDVWIVDRGTDRVYRFNGGAGLTSGTHSADSSYSLDGGNKAARGITTDGTSLWVVNGRNNVDKVFKYTVSGSLLGSWEIDSRNSTPEGITIDPNNVDTIWIVDRGTSQVFEYPGGASRTSASQHADAVFDLAGANSNPRGIADPPSWYSLGGMLNSVEENANDLEIAVADLPPEHDIDDHERHTQEVEILDALHTTPGRWLRDLSKAIRDDHYMGKSENVKAQAIDELLARWHPTR